MSVHKGHPGKKSLQTSGLVIHVVLKVVPQKSYLKAGGLYREMVTEAGFTVWLKFFIYFFL